MFKVTVGMEFPDGDVCLVAPGTTPENAVAMPRGLLKEHGSH
eukprot:CAMPEP_0174374806 /NCGR_PEP_ID=MMETSP0811_2-20130205/112243_1 /TAXON_ID=73025 ORGANISM="Eutreptiella gymnastica-like, Strain CCMP1594" /NCGR_SAMPLE_ID=MMETSP0811_2 /ASSEMBLY_ACC=CAM_ASM_000667 /LENGTH=41 /DNA_ID= /DNA_START= /DNA_END= /DNA_ORIENTATION=